MADHRDISPGVGGRPGDSLLSFAAARPETENPACADRWKVLIVDDELEVHTLTRLVLRTFEFEGRGLELISAYSGLAARRALAEHPDVAVILLDVVMEREDSGLQLVEHVREEMGNRQVRIVLRTGQPGQAPEFEIVSRYDINDYKSKTELTSLKLHTTVTSALRAWRDIRTIEESRQGLARLISASAGLFEQRSRSAFLRSVLNDLVALAEPRPGDDPAGAAGTVAGLLAERAADGFRVTAACGSYTGSEGRRISSVVPDRAALMLARASRRGEGVFFNHSYACCLQTAAGHEALFLLQGRERLGGADGNLIHLYMANAVTAFDNVTLSEEILATQSEVIQTLGEVVETRSRETANHVRRVGCMAELLALKTGVPAADAALLRMAAPMHDVGKVGIPDAILNKQCRLTAQEYRVMQSHAQLGHDILAKSERPLLKAAAVIAGQHHERWDGRGYPNGLAGEEIHIFGRITALVDVFDAMSNRRVYRDAIDPEHVLQVIREGAGTHFDPRLVAIFLAHLDEFRQVMERLPDVEAGVAEVLQQGEGVA